jgi:hypothetical protein
MISSLLAFASEIVVFYVRCIDAVIDGITKHLITLPLHLFRAGEFALRSQLVLISTLIYGVFLYEFMTIAFRVNKCRVLRAICHKMGGRRMCTCGLRHPSPPAWRYAFDLLNVALGSTIGIVTSYVTGPVPIRLALGAGILHLVGAF